MAPNQHLGSSLNSFLEEEGLLDELEAYPYQPITARQTTRARQSECHPANDGESRARNRQKT